MASVLQGESGARWGGHTSFSAAGVPRAGVGKGDPREVAVINSVNFVLADSSPKNLFFYPSSHPLGIEGLLCLPNLEGQKS